MRKQYRILLSVLIMSVFAISCSAHEFIINPVQFSVEKGSKIPFSVVSAHVFMVSEEMEPINFVDAFLIQGKDKTQLKLQPNSMLLTLDGAAECKKKGFGIISGHRKGMIWTKTTKGWKQASRKGLKGVISSGKYEKFCKTLINTDKSDEGFAQVIGDKLEIVPVSNPALAMTGAYMEFKILFDGKPLSTEVFATYDGFSDNPNTYAYYTECNDNGIAKVKITHPGTWMVRVQKKVDQVTEDYDLHVMRSVLVFEVK